MNINNFTVDLENNNICLSTQSEDRLSLKSKKLKIKLKIIRDSRTLPLNSSTTVSSIVSHGVVSKNKSKTFKELRMKSKRLTKEGSFNCGRWQPDEHKRFIEAILKYGNEWKLVQKHVGTRSSTQARSHAQKFFFKIKKANILDLEEEPSKNSIKTLHTLANSFTSDEYSNTVETLNFVAYEKRNQRKKLRREGNIVNDLTNGDFDSTDSKSAIAMTNFRRDTIAMIEEEIAISNPITSKLRCVTQICLITTRFYKRQPLC